MAYEVILKNGRSQLNPLMHSAIKFSIFQHRNKLLKKFIINDRKIVSEERNSMKRYKVIFYMAFAGLFLAGSLSMAYAEKDHGAHWEYEGDTGPDHWGDLKEEFLVCKDGENQSPVNFEQVDKAKAPQLEFHYKETPLNIVNNGHTIQVNYESGSYLMIGERKFDLLQFHFHVPSEHSVKGKPLDMEMHLVHKNEKNDLAVVGVFYTVAGTNRSLNPIWENLPKKVNEPFKNETIIVNANDFLPENKNYFFYSGSLTTPPCSEGVLWHVLNQPLPVTQEQVDRFKELMGNNARPAQPLNQRGIHQAN